MSTLLLTLASRLHCQPEMSSVSFEPVANVVVSNVRNVVPVLLKSFSKSAPVKFPGSEAFWPLTVPRELPGAAPASILNRLSQS